MNKNKKTSIPLSIVALGIVSFFTDAATEMIYPLIPIFISLLGSGALALGVIEGVAETTASLLKFFGGLLSDKTGKRKIFVLLGYSISSIIRPLTGIVSSAWHIVFIRMADRIGKGVRTAPRDALIASAADPTIRGKAYGFHRAMDHAGAVAGPFIAIIVLVLLFYAFTDIVPLNALRITFFLALIPGLMAILTIIFFVKEKKISEKNPNIKENISVKSLNKNFLIYLAIISLFTLGNSSDAFLLFRVAGSLEQSGALLEITENLPFLNIVLGRFTDVGIQKSIISIFTLPFFWAFFHILKSALSTPLSALSDKTGRKIIISVGWCIYALVYLGFAFTDYIPENLRVLVYIGLFAVYAFYYALTEGVEKALVADIAPGGITGTAFGAYNFAIGIFALPASIIFGAIYNAFGATPAFLLGSIIAFVSVACLLLLVSEEKNSE